MALAVLSDIHGNIDALEAVLADIERRGITDMVNLGDMVSGPFDSAGTLDRLMAMAIPTVRGNHDRQLIDRPREDMGKWELWAIDDLTETHLDWIRALPETHMLDDIFLCHATPDRDDENWLDHRGPGHRLIARDLSEVEARITRERAPLMLCGHTHQPRVVRLPDGTTIVNPGSVGCPAYCDIRVEPPFIHQTGSPDARYAIVERRGVRWHADLIAVPYDASRMAELALAKGAESWARAITTGWFV